MSELGNDQYLSLFTPQYQNSPKLINFADKLMKGLNDISLLALNMDSYFDIDIAIGNQLDIIGEIVGAKRILDFDPTPIGSPPVAVSPILDDETYRILLKATIGINHWNGLMSSIKPLWLKLFPDGYIIYIDNLDMSITIILAGVFSSVIIDLITHGLIIPRPEGVLMNYQFGEMPFFGFDSDNDYIAGFDKGHFS